jgi:hypothetical protein
MTAKTIVINWLDSLENGEVFFTWNFESQVPHYGKIKYNKIHTASTYSRAFRQVRQEDIINKELMGFALTEVKSATNGKIKGWKKINTISN